MWSSRFLSCIFQVMCRCMTIGQKWLMCVIIQQHPASSFLPPPTIVHFTPSSPFFVSLLCPSLSPTHPSEQYLPDSLGRVPVACYAGHMPSSRWHLWQTPSWCPVHTAAEATLALQQNGRGEGRLVGEEGWIKEAGISEKPLISLLVKWKSVCFFFPSWHQRPLSFLSHRTPPTSTSHFCLPLSVSCSFVFHIPFH